MDVQLILVGLILALAILYLARRTWRTWAGKGRSCGGCKCGDNKPRETLIPVDQLHVRRRD
jgi:hypothetical protein